MANTSAAADIRVIPTSAHNQWLVIGASSLGTVFEWYDFYLYGLLAGIISAQFFSGVNEVTGFIFALAAFAAGFAVRPFGALVFGRLGDLVGRKHTFLITMSIMGGATFAVGLLPELRSGRGRGAGALVLLRLLQGLALGGEYGGAATYVAEHAPPGKRGLYTSWIQTTATLGLFVCSAGRHRHPHLHGRGRLQGLGLAHSLSGLLLLLEVSLWIRMQLAESPVFLNMKKLGTTSKAPLVGGVRPLVQFEDRADRSARCGHGPGRGVVHGPVLRAVLPGADAAGRRRDHQHIDGDCAGAGHSGVHFLRLAVR